MKKETPIEASKGDVVKVRRVSYHVTSVRNASVYGHEAKRCDEAGCAGDELYLGPLKPRPGVASTGLADASVLVTGPALLLAAVEAAAQAEGVSVREWWRRAARLRLGWHEVLPIS